jgi:hypothetical protein
MKIFTNDKLIKRNKTLGNVLSLASIGILGTGMFFSFKDKDGSYLPYTFGALIVGFLLFQVGNYFMNRWGKSPRPDEKIAQALKGLDSNYSLYQYTTPIPHLLVGPAGVFTLLPYNQPGTIKYDPERGRWKQSGGNFFLKAFGGENLGRPELDAKYSVADVIKYLGKSGINLDPYSPQPVLVFTNSKSYVETEGSSTPAVTQDKLKEFIRKQAKWNSVPAEMLLKIKNLIEE